MQKFKLNNIKISPTSNHPQIPGELKVTIRQSRLKESLSANAEMLTLYWQIGKTIVEQQK
ncbi:hypothetical protein [Dyadobacter sp. CY343]|uniref:hypothetical protein n=1 Tax=Dyadobacter sp. CY343 TaxID=2907299 RepID=UPI001F41C8C3|nr:hypothetical protein [Dyadobacter sp. CY343]MCE7062349.1 hypothetical protein [Dyadobacter sp. CY343]